MRWHRLQILMDRLKNDIQDQAYYLATADGTVLQRQVIQNVSSAYSDLQKICVMRISDFENGNSTIKLETRK